MKAELLALDKHCKAWLAVLGSISHTLVTKLATLRMKHKSLKEVLPEILQGYRLAIEHNLLDGKISEDELKSLSDTANLEEQILPMMNLLESVNTFGNELRLDSHLLSARNCVNELLAIYPFENESQKKSINFEDSNDFNFRCLPIFINALLRNLLSNGLRSIDKSGKGHIRIWISDKEGNSSLHFKDMGLGMNERACARIFSHALSHENDKEIPGLGLCRLAIQLAGGDIICNTVHGEHTHIQITFPKVGAH